MQDEPPWSGYAPYVRCLLDELPSGALAVTPRIISGADEFLAVLGRAAVFAVAGKCRCGR